MKSKCRDFFVCVAAGIVTFTPLYQACAVEPTQLEAAEAYAGKTFELELESALARFDDTVLEVEGTAGYAFTDKAKLELSLPVEHDDDDTGFGDVRTKFYYMFNPEAVRGPRVGASLELAFPTGKDEEEDRSILLGQNSGEDHSGVDTELALYLTQPIGGEAAQQALHLNLIGTHNAGAADEDRDFLYSAILGYSRALSPKTMLVTDFVREQLDERDENANILEVGVKHEASHGIELALGAGAGLGEESPDFTAHAGIGFKFGRHQQ